MPIRKDPLLTNEIFHVFNKTIDGKVPFATDYYSNEFYERLVYYRSTQSIRSFSKLSNLASADLQQVKIGIMIPEHFQVEILNYNLMSNHYHLLVKQLKDDGIKNLISNTTNSFTKHSNIKEQRHGQIFLREFQAVRIVTDEQLIHTSRYIDLNNYSSGLINNIEDLATLKWSGFPAYLGLRKDKLVNSDFILSMFKDSEEYKNFVFDRADYQKSLETIKHTEKFK
ncbi:MAG: transposase [bacterium]|nr:transposase [bacterium]